MRIRSDVGTICTLSTTIYHHHHSLIVCIVPHATFLRLDINSWLYAMCCNDTNLRNVHNNADRLFRDSFAVLEPKSGCAPYLNR